MTTKDDADDSSVFGVPWTWPVRSSPITRLQIYHAFTSVGVVCKFIRACKALTSFTCATYFVSDMSAQWFSHIATALHEHSETLQEITIKVQSPMGQWTWAHFDIFRRGRLHSLSSMVCLKTLQTPLRILVDHIEPSALPDALPQSLEDLTLQLHEEWDAALERHLELLLAVHTAGRFSALKQVTLIWRRIGFNLDFAPSLAKLRELYQARSVELHLKVESKFSQGRCLHDNRMEIARRLTQLLVPSVRLLQQYEDMFPTYLYDITEKARHTHYIMVATCPYDRIADGDIKSYLFGAEGRWRWRYY
jgi:hypothetical protein